MRERFVEVQMRAVPTSPVDDGVPEVADGGASEKQDASLELAAERIAVPVLGPALADRFDEGPGGLKPHFPKGVKESARVLLPERSTGVAHLEDAATGTAIDIALQDTRESRGEVADGYVIYEQGYGAGATTLRHATPAGCEDFVSFDARPAQPAVTYKVVFLKGVSGLRLVANSVEMLDEGGAPRLRVAPPSIVGSDGVRTEAKLELSDCSYDANPAGPWGRAVVRPGADTCTLRVSWSDEAVAYPALLDPTWSTTQNTMTAARRGHSATLMSTGRVLVAGGTTNGTAPVASAELYDPATNTWSTTASMGTARVWHSASQLPTSSNTTTSGKVVAAGGATTVAGTQSISSSELYSPSAGTWMLGADLGTPRHLHTATVMSNGQVLVAGGQGGTTVFQTATVYDPSGTSVGSWNSTANMAVKRRGHTATLLSIPSNANLNNRVMIVGGNNGTASQTSVQLFNGSSWNTVAQSPPALSTGREGHTATLLANGKVLIAGGKNGTTLTGAALLLDTSSNFGTWVSAGTLNTARQLHTATLLSTSIRSGGVVLLAGGTTEGIASPTTSTATAELFDGVNVWTNTTSLLAATRDHTANLLSNGLVLMAGGLTTSTPLATAELYEPSNGVSCTAANQCFSGFCVNGVCCNSACTGECSACNIAGAVGTCTAKAGGTACGDDGNVCTVDTCDGTSFVCQHAAGNAGTTCRNATDVCDVTETCTGSSTSCPTDVKAAAGTPCPDGNACNGAEICDGSGVCNSGTPVTCNATDCRTAGTCDPATGLCSGTARPDGFPCDDGNGCTRTDVCALGVCRGSDVPGCTTKIAVEDLGSLGGSSNARQINDFGVVVGTSQDAQGIQHLVRWTPAGSIEQLNDAESFGSAINNAGVIAGYLGSSGAASVRYTDATGFLTIDPPGTTGSFGLDINATNSIAGYAWPPTGARHAVRYTDARGHEWIPFLPGRAHRSWAYGIDNQNNVVGGSSTTLDETGSHAFWYIDAESRVQDLNDFASIGWELRVGYATNGDEIVGPGVHDGIAASFRLALSTGRIDDLGSLGGLTLAQDINDSGAIVGVATLPNTTPSSRAIVYTEQLGLVNLDTVADPAQGWLLRSASGINNNGDIVGWGIRQGVQHAFRMHVPGLFPARVPRCQTGADCATGFCVDGICCNTACISQCSSCRLPGSFGTCLQRPVGASCTNGDKCASVDTCNASGVCISGPPPIVDDDNPCTTDSCDPGTGVKHTPLPWGASCSDGNACNGQEICGPWSDCRPGAVVVDDGNPCTDDSTCDPVLGPRHVPLPVGTPCNNLCLTGGTGTCDSAGTCAGGPAVTCTALDRCHGVGTCNPTTGQCSNPVLSSASSCRQRCSSDFTGDGFPDVIGKGSTDGKMRYLEGDGHGGLKSSTPTVFDEGWEDYDAILAPGDFDSDGAPDILARRAVDGVLFFYRGTGTGTLVPASGVQIAIGWEPYTDLITPGDFDGDGHPDVIVRTVYGMLLLFRGDGAGGFADPWGTLIASGWTDYLDVISPGDFGAGNSADTPGTEDGVADIIARKSDGTLWLYRGIGNGTLAQNPGYQIEEGWAPYSKLLRAGDFDGDGHADVLAAKPDGSLYLYRGAGNGTFVQVPPVFVGAGFNQFSTVCVPVEARVPSGTSCSDGNACTSNDTCNGSGTCVSGTPTSIDDNNPCTTDSCDPLAGVQHVPVHVGTSCSDGNACNGAETCDASGQCSPGTPINCGVADQCHGAGTCDPVTGMCSNPQPNGLPCNDGDACTKTDVCQSGICIGTTVPGCAAKIPVEDMGTLPGGERSGAQAINDSGVTVGYSYDSTPAYRIVRWPPGPAIETLGPSYAGAAYGINNAGVIAGAVFGGQAFRYSDTSGFTFLSPTGVQEYGIAINESNSVTGFDATQAFRYTDAHGHEFLGFLPGGNRSFGCAIDDQDNVVGWSTVATTPPGNLWNPGHAFRYVSAQNQMQDLNQFAPVGWELHKANGVNGDEIVGFARHEQVVQAYRLTLSTGRVDDLGTFEGGGISYALNMNKNGAVAGAAYLDGTGTGNFRAAVFTEQLGPVNLNNAVDPAENWVLAEANDVNENGDVVGWGFHNGNIRGFRMHVPGLNPARVPRCQNNSQCGTGFCSPQGVCCDTACTDGCSSCMLPGKVGTCSTRPAGARCSAKSVCDGGGDVCDANGACVPGSGPPDVNDNNPCTTDTCDPSTGAQHTPNPGASCSDGNACNGVETCDATGQCQSGQTVNCGVPDACHLAGVCDPATGTCTFPPGPAGTSCSDGNACNGIEQCDGAGNCITSGGPPNTEDGDPCTDYTGCDPVTGPIQTRRPQGANCDSLCLTGGVGTCDANGACVGATAVTCTASDQCHGVGTCDPMTGVCSDPPLPDGTTCDDGSQCTATDTCVGGLCGGVDVSTSCSPECPCNSGKACTDSSQCGGGTICDSNNGRYFGKDPLTSNCWSPTCPVTPDLLGCGGSQAPCGVCNPRPRVCASDTDCQSTNEVCGQGNGVAFGLGNVNVCWPAICAGGQTLCGSPLAPCGNCACTSSCSSKNCSTADKTDLCSGYCTGLCGDGETGCDADFDCQGSSVCVNRVCLPPSCLQLDPTRGCEGSNASCPTCPACVSQCAGRSCGPDPSGCTASCGPECAAGSVCANGQCVPFTGIPPLVSGTSDIGAVDGDFTVTKEGEAQYSIPIVVPPGRAAMQPSVSLVYSSDKRLGTPGIGWRLAGFSSISRCPRSMAQDGVPGPVRYDDNDRYCLDGKRLVRVPADGPAVAGAVYHTEVDDFSKIVIVDVAPNNGGPVSFKVYTKAGTILTYGDTEDSSVYHRPVPLFVDRLVKRVWAISKVEDRNGNQIHYTYQTRSSALNTWVGDAQEMVPIEVSYGANPGAGLPDDRSVKFEYEDMPIRAAHFVNGAASMMRQRLETIATYGPSGLIRTYHLSAADVGFVTRLTGVSECVPDTVQQEVCKPATNFFYDNDPALGPAEHQKAGLVHLVGWTGQEADVTGTGTDLWWISGWPVYNRGSASFPLGSAWGILGPTIDLENDGKDEILLGSVVHPNKLQIARWSPGWMTTQYSVDVPGLWEADYVTAADLNGDGFKDFLMCHHRVSDVDHDRLAVVYGQPVDIRYTTHLGTALELENWGDCTPRFLLVDVDGDGVVNLMRPATPDPKLGTLLNWKALVLHNDVNNPESSPAWVDVDFAPPGNAYAPPGFHTLDANGDGLTDVIVSVASFGSSFGLWLNRGDFRFQAVAGAANVVGIPFDVDGDGNDDLLAQTEMYRWRPGQVNPLINTTTENNPFIRFRTPDGDGNGSPFFADVDGDGDLDLIDLDISGTSCKQSIASGEDMDTVLACAPQIRRGHSRRMHLLKRVVDGLGRQIEIDYTGRATQENNDACKGDSNLLCPRKFHPLVGEHRFFTQEGTDKTLRKRFRYGYANARAGVKGRGSFGFGKHTVTEFDGDMNPDSDLPFSITTDVFYNEDFVRAGLLQEHTVTSGAASDVISGVVQSAQRLLRENNVYQTKNINGRSSFPVLTEQQSKVFDKIGGAELPVSSTKDTYLDPDDVDHSYDRYGNGTYHRHQTFVGDTSGVSVTDDIAKHQYKEPDEENWLVGLLQREEVRSTHDGAPGETVGPRVWSMQYDSNRLIQRTRSPENAAFQMVEVYDYGTAPPYNLQQYTVQPNLANDMRFVIFSYDQSEMYPEIVTNALGHQQITHFDPRFGVPVDSTDANNVIETREYDGFGRLIHVEGPKGDVRIELKHRDDALPGLTAPGVADHAVYRILTQELAHQGTTIGGVVLEDIGPRGEILKRSTTGYMRKAGTQWEDQWVEEEFTYDVAGRLRFQTRPHLDGDSSQGQLEFVYDKLGVLTTENYPDGSTVAHARGSRNTWQATPGIFSQFAVTVDVVTKRDFGDVNYSTGSAQARDPSGLVVTARDAKGTFSDYTYGAFNQLRFVQAVRGEQASSEIMYDDYGRKSFHVDPDTGTESYSYTPFDQINATADARGIIHSYEYDRLGRPFHLTSWIDGQSPSLDDTTWTYDGIPGANETGKLVQVSYGTAGVTDRHTTRYRYKAGNVDLVESVERKIGAETFTTGFEYDDFLRPFIVHYPTPVGENVVVQREYDPRGNLRSVFKPGSNNAYWAVSTDPNKGSYQGYKIADEQFGNGVNTHSQFHDQTGRLLRIQTTVGINPSVPLQDMEYGYWANGNLGTRNNHQNAKVENFHYDDLDRLTDVDIGNINTHLADYAPNGNFQFKAGVGSYTYDHLNGVGPVHAPRLAGSRTFTYDANGNELTRTGGPEGQRTTEYTPFNLPSHIVDGASETMFEYDGNQSRVLKVVNDVQQTLYAGEIYERIDDSALGNVRTFTHKFKIFANGKQVAQIERKESDLTDKVLYLHGDHLGSTQLVTDGAGGVSSAIVIAEQTFDPWGKPEGTPAWDPTKTPNVHTGFTGHEHDSEHGLINMRGRIYDPELGRFTTADPFVQAPFYSQSLNRYAYVFNNPLRHVDPSGFFGGEVGDTAPMPSMNGAEAIKEKDRGKKGSPKAKAKTPTEANSTPQGGAQGTAPTSDSKAVNSANKEAQPNPGTDVTKPSSPAPTEGTGPGAGAGPFGTSSTPGAGDDAQRDGIGRFREGSPDQRGAPGGSPQRGLPQRVAEGAMRGITGIVCGFLGCNDAGEGGKDHKTEGQKVAASAITAGALLARPFQFLRGPGAAAGLGVAKAGPWAGEPLTAVATEETTMYRVWGGGSEQAGEWLAPSAPQSAAEAQASLALPPQNTAEFVSPVTVPAGTRFQIGQAGPLFGHPGGGIQVRLIDRIPESAFGPGVPLR